MDDITDEGSRHQLKKVSTASEAAKDVTPDLPSQLQSFQADEEKPVYAEAERQSLPGVTFFTNLKDIYAKTLRLKPPVAFMTGTARLATAVAWSKKEVIDLIFKIRRAFLEFASIENDATEVIIRCSSMKTKSKLLDKKCRTINMPVLLIYLQCNQ